MAIADHLEVERVSVGVEAASKKRILEALTRILAESLDGIATSRMLDALFRRERLGSTCIGFGVALPHARLAGVEEPISAFVRLSEPVDFDDEMPVTAVLALLLPEDAGIDCGVELSDIARLFADGKLSEQVAAAEDAEEVYRLLVEARMPGQDLQAGAL